MKIKEQTRQLAAGCSKHWIELTWFEEIFEEYETKTYSF
ncbi:chlorohydrolase [Streptococcus pneumoniae]|nr:chlorohydrolase [Streptococcus pneumoniae]